MRVWPIGAVSLVFLGCLAVPTPAAGAFRAGDGTKEQRDAKGAAKQKPPTTKPSTKRGPALLIDKLYVMVTDTKPSKKLMPQIDAAFDETRLKVDKIERTQRSNRGWMKARIEQEIDALVLLVGDMLTAKQLDQLRKAYSEHKANIPSAQRRRQRSGAKQ